VFAECKTACEARPELFTVACQDAYAALNACVAALSCDDLARYENPDGGERPCSTEVAAIVPACASM